MTRTQTIAACTATALCLTAHAQQEKEQHWRKYKKLEPAAKITIVVEKAANGKPIESAGVVFKATDKDGRDEGGLEIKSDPDGHATLDVIEVGSHVKVQVIAPGYSTAAVEFDVPTDEKRVVVRMEKPRAQISAYEENTGKPSARPVGVQEPPPILKTTKKPSGLMAIPSGPAAAPAAVAAPGTPGGAGAPPTAAPAAPATTPATPSQPQ